MDTTHRCDADVAEQAQVRVERNGCELLFCKHHFYQHWEGLMSRGWEVIEDVPVPVPA